MAPTDKEGVGSMGPDFTRLVESTYKVLYRFAFSLTHNEAEAGDLTQETFYLWATRGQQLRDPTKARTWLFTTLYREFLKTRRKQERFRHLELSEVKNELPTVAPTILKQMDWQTVIEAFGQIDEVYQGPLVLFYLEDNSYQEISEVLEIPMGTVMSRIARGREQLQAILRKRQKESDTKITPFPRQKP